MSETKFTPGPWSVTDSHYPSFKEISGPSFGIKAVMWATDLTEDDYQKRYADLHLIAAAPELYETLEAIIARWDTPLWKDIEPTGVFIGKGRAALAKARGEE